MFNRSDTKYPIDAEAKGWIERRMAWLVAQFGWDRLLNGTVVLPTEDYFPDPFDGSFAAVRALLDRVAEYMDVDATGLDLELYWEDATQADFAGHYDTRDGRTIIWINRSHLDDPIALVATLAHELGHWHLIGQKRVTGEEDDHEPLTDLVAVFFGLGVFAANSWVRDRTKEFGTYTVWTISRQGYVTAPMFGYALALYAWLRAERKPAWARWLRADARVPFRQSLSYLIRTGDSTLTKESRLSVDVASIAKAPVQARATRPDTESPDDVEFDVSSADGYFTRATIHVRHGEMELALADFDEAVRLAPDDAECYQQRSLVLSQLGRHAEGLTDAEEAIRLDPDNAESYRARGIAYLGAGDYPAAITDLSRYIREEKGETGAYYRLGDGYYLRGLAYAGLNRWRRAIADYTRAIRRWPQRAESYAARATAYEKIGKIVKSQADREQAVRLDPSLAEGQG